MRRKSRQNFPERESLQTQTCRGWYVPGHPCSMCLHYPGHDLRCCERFSDLLGDGLAARGSVASGGEYVISFNAVQMFTAALQAVFKRARQLKRLQSIQMDILIHYIIVVIRPWLRRCSTGTRFLYTLIARLHLYGLKRPRKSELKQVTRDSDNPQIGHIRNPLCSRRFANGREREKGSNRYKLQDGTQKQRQFLTVFFCVPGGWLSDHLPSPRPDFCVTPASCVLVCRYFSGVKRSK